MANVKKKRRKKITKHKYKKLRKRMKAMRKRQGK
ncbi:MAG: AURKAIP1/COX24 domain-containing protein [bacterium]